MGDSVDWIAKRRLLTAYADRHGLSPTDARLRAMDLQYHDLRPERCLSDRLGLERLVSPEEVLRCVEEPPELGVGVAHLAVVLGEHPLEVGDARQALAPAHEDLHAELVFERLDLPAQSGLLWQVAVRGIDPDSTQRRHRPRGS